MGQEKATKETLDGQSSTAPGQCMPQGPVAGGLQPMNVDAKEEKEEKEETKKATDELEEKVERKMDAIEQTMMQFKDAMQTIVQTQQEMKKDSDQGLINLQTESANQAARIKADMKMLQSRPQAFRTKPRAANNQAKPAEVAEVEGSESEEQRRLDKKGNLRTPPRLPR